MIDIGKLFRADENNLKKELKYINGRATWSLNTPSSDFPQSIWQVRNH